MRPALHSPNVAEYCIFSIKWVIKFKDNIFMFMQSHCWNYSLDFQTSFGISKVLRERKKIKLKGVKDFMSTQFKPQRSY